MNQLLKRLLGFLFPGVDDGDPPDAGGDPGGSGADADGVGSADPGGGGVDTDPPEDDLDFDLVEPAPTRRQPTTADDRISAVEAQLAEARRALESRAHAPAATGTPNADPDFEAEEARLRSPDITDLERWQIQSNRALREQRRIAAQALFQAQDLSDRTAFEAKIASDPHRARYRDRVESAIQEERRQGRNASREAVYYYMLGKDIAEGKLRAKAKPKTPAADIPRGKTPGVRSTVPPSRGMTEHQKRAARLADVNI
jgi:hypothetical protein